MKKLILALAILASSLSPAFAGNNLTITCDNSQCTTVPGSIPIFYEINILPGYRQTQILTVENQRLTSCHLLLNSQNTDGEIPDILADKINISIKKSTTTFFNQNLINFFGTTDIDLGILPPSSSHQYTWQALFDPSAGNEYQDRDTHFDLTFNFTCDDQSSTPTPTLTPTVTPTATPTPYINPPSGVILNEIMANPPSGKEWVEIYNSNAYPVELRQWKIDDDPSTGGVCNPRNLNIVNLPAYGFYVYEYPSNCLNNTGDIVRLLNQDNVLVDSRTYTENDVSTELSYSRQPDNSWCTATPTYNLVNNPCFGIGGDDGGGDGDNPSSPTCSASAPGAPTLISASPGTNTVTLVWSEPAYPYTYYLIAYGTSSGNYQYGNPNVGGPGTTSYVVASLSSGQTYCFVVRAGNDCMPGSFSNEICTSPGGIVLPAAGPAPGFIPGVLGEQITPTPQPLINPLILGTTADCPRRWLPILYILALLLNGLYLYKYRQNLFIPFFLSLLALLIDLFFLRTRCCLVANWYCRWFWLGNIISFLLPVYLYRRLGKES